MRKIYPLYYSFLGIANFDKSAAQIRCRVALSRLFPRFGASRCCGDCFSYGRGTPTENGDLSNRQAKRAFAMDNPYPVFTNVDNPFLQSVANGYLICSLLLWQSRISPSKSAL